MLVDCGVASGTMEAAAKIEAILNDVTKTTGGHLDLLILTHKHWDHLSGLVLAESLFSKLKIDELWLPWTEDPKDELAQKLSAEQWRLRAALSVVSGRLKIEGAEDALVDELLALFGEAGSGFVEDALRIARAIAGPTRYCGPTDSPIELRTGGAKIYVLGPPRDEGAIKRLMWCGEEFRCSVDQFLMDIATATIVPARGAPFESSAEMSLASSRNMPFFQAYYWSEKVRLATGAPEADVSWRRIDVEWLRTAPLVALYLDSTLDNMSLTFALELANGEIFLFAADAQVGSWLSWQELRWTVAGKMITSADLLNRTVLYKVGHHGSPVGTLQEQGLERMYNLKMALIPVDSDMALNKGWTNMPFRDLELRLNEITGGHCLRADRPVPPALAGQVKQNSLYYEVKL
jgi:hypothetical protein